jgi:cysteinyl-tRNA synthetase
LTCGSLQARDQNQTKAEGDTTAADRQLLTSLETAKGDVDEALRDSFNTSVVMRILADIVTEFNSAEALSDQTVILLAQWITRMVAIFALDPEGDINNSSRIGWSGLEIPEPAKPYVYAASNLRDKIRLLAFADSTDHASIGKLTEDSATASSTAVPESSKPYHKVLQQFRTNLTALASRQASARDLLSLCDQLRDVQLWDLGIYLEDRKSPPSALVRPLDKLIIEARAERESIILAKAKAKREQEARDAEKEQEQRERAKVDPLLMYKLPEEYSEWDENGIPTNDATETPVSGNKRKKLLKEWEKQKKRHEEWLATQ